MLVTTPRFGMRGKPTEHGRARPPAVMARLRIERMCCNRASERTREDKGEKPVCLGRSIPICDEPVVLPEGVHQASAFSETNLASVPGRILDEELKILMEVCK